MPRMRDMVTKNMAELDDWRRLYPRLAVIMLAVVALSGCESLSFYSQAVTGQTKLMMQRTPVETLLEAQETEPALRHRLALSQEILAYAESQGLPGGDSYKSYVETGQPYVIWNVFAAPPLMLQLERSCFPVAGCVSYRGYFAKEDADRHAGKLRSQGFDVYVGGVTAYSTLGWFADPLLDTFLFRDEDRLAALIFHELAHQLIYVAGDTRFNESFATAVEKAVLRSWLISRDQQHRYDAYIEGEKRRSAVLELIAETREALRELYASAADDKEKLAGKQALLESMVTRYGELQASWSSGNEFSYWMSSGLNNAKLETVADYNEWVPAFELIYQRVGLAGLFDKVRELAELSTSARHAELEALLTESKQH